MHGTIFYTSVTGLTSGIFFRSFFDGGLPGIFAILLIGIALGVAGRLRGQSRVSILILTSLFFISFGIGALRFEVSDSRVSPLASRVGESGAFTGIVAREPDRRETSQHLYVKEAETGALLLVTTDAYASIEYGDRIEVRGTLTEPEPFETENGRTFDYRGYLRAKGVSEMISFGTVEVVGHGQGNPIMVHLLQVKARFMRSLEIAIPEPAAGLGEGMLLGVKRALGEELSETFRIVGIIHIVVLSGYNIMIVADSVMRVLGYFFFPRTRFILGVLSIVLFALLVGLSATVVRASIMAGLVLIARNTGRAYAVLRALSLTGALMLLHNPYLLAFDPGFQLSFLATLGLILLSPQFETRFTRIPEFIRGHLATTLGTQLFVLPILLFSMGTLSLVSVLVNVLVLPMVPYAMLMTFVVGLIGLVSLPLSLIAGYVAHLVLSYIITIAKVFATLPFAAIEIPAFPFLVVAVSYALLGVWTYFLMQRSTKKEPTTTNTLLNETVNEYDGWIIEAVVRGGKASPGTRSVPGDADLLPFR